MTRIPPRHQATPSCTTQAFTLIELMIAVSLGMLIVYTATAAFRVASQAVTTANRLSLENAIMRAGFQLAHRDLDFWTNVDDPDVGPTEPLAATALGLRPWSAGKGGLPFTPFRTSWPGAIADTEAAIGHDPRDSAWAVGNPRGWWRGQMAEKNGSDLRFGRYSLFANRSPTLGPGKLATVASSITGGTPPMTTTTEYVYASAATIAVPHSWLYGQIDGLQNALGFYGLCDYLPANAIYAFYAPYVKDGEHRTNSGGMPMWLIDPGGSFNNGDGGQQTPRGKYRNSYQTSYAIIDPRSTPNTAELLTRHRSRYHLGYNSNEGSHNTFNTWSAVPTDIMVRRPENWPGLTVSVQRFIKNTRFVNIARVTWTNTLTGQTSELSFSGFGTTLRGARQQRKQDGGWAKWDNDGSPTDPTLDSN